MFFKPGLIFAGKINSLASEFVWTLHHFVFKVFSLTKSALPANIKIAWKNFLGTKILADFYEVKKVYDVAARLRPRTNRPEDWPEIDFVSSQQNLAPKFF